MLLESFSKTGATGIEPAIYGLTGRRVNRYTTPPDKAKYYQKGGEVST